MSMKAAGADKPPVSAKGRAVRTFIFWVFADTRLSRLTRFATDGSWSHMGLGFVMDTGFLCIYEALWAEKGFVGPKPFARVMEFAAENPKRKLALQYTGLDEQTSERKRLVCEASKGVLSYGPWQLAMMGLSERYHVPVPKSERKVVCSEIVSRILQPEIDLRDGRRRTDDHVNPNSAWRRWLEVKTGYGWLNGPPPARLRA